MSVIRLDCFSNILGRDVTVNILVPQNSKEHPNRARPPFPVLYLLHGLSENQDTWLRCSSIARYAANRNLAVVMPSTDRGFYTDTTYGTKYFTFISEELPEIVNALLPISQKREDTFAAGLSMGGYGALKLALRLPERFSFAASLSGALMSREMISAWYQNHSNTGAFADEMRSIFGLDDNIKPCDDVFALLRNNADSSIKPDLFLCCGEDDNELFALARLYHSEAQKLGYNATWSQAPGYGHEWAYWDMMITKVLDMLPENTKE